MAKKIKIITSITQEACNSLRLLHGGQLPYLKGSAIYVNRKLLKWDKRALSY